MEITKYVPLKNNTCCKVHKIKILKSMACGGIEPTTFALLARRSNQLS